LQDPKYNVFVPLRAFGQFGIKIGDAKVFLQKLVGTLSAFTADDIVKYFRGMYLTKVKDAIATYLIKRKISVLEINAYIDELSLELKTALAPTLSEFGIDLINFYVNDISVPEEDEAVIKLKTALAKKAEMDIIGYNYTQERSFDTLEGAATNPGSGSAPLMGAGIGLGMGVGLGSGLGGAVGGIAQSINTNPGKKCPHCNLDVTADAKFCPHCGKETTLEAGHACPKCGTINRDGTKFCAECGNLLIKVCAKCGEAVSEKQKFCPNCGTSMVKVCGGCGAELADGLNFCPECGKKVEGDNNA
jgi:membrane protease subunit (stomatin/prohibitin family)